MGIHWYQIMAGAPETALFITAAFALIRAWQRREYVRRNEEMYMVALGVVWAAAAIVQTVVPAHPAAVIASQVQINCVAVVPWMLVRYAARYTQYKAFLTLKTRVGLVIAPSIMHILTLSNQWHGWVVTERVVSQFGQVTYLRSMFGPAYAIYMVYCAVSLLMAVLMIARSVDRTILLSHWRPFTVIACFVGIAVGSVIQVFWLPSLQTASIAYLLASLTLLTLDQSFITRDIMPTMWKALFEGMDDIAFVIDKDDCIVSANPAAGRLMFSGFENLEGCKLSSVWQGSPASLQALLAEHSARLDVVISGDDDASVYEVQVTSLSMGDNQDLVRGYVLRDVTLSRRAQQITERDRGELETLVSLRTRGLESANRELKREISQRMRVQARLERSEERFVKLFEDAPLAYYLNDIKGVFLDGNRAAEELLGYEREELVGRNMMEVDLLARRDMLRAGTLLASNALGNGTGPDEFLLRRKDGTRVPVEISTIPIRIDDHVTILGAVHDLSRRKKYEMELRDARDKLEQRVRERTAELAETNIALVAENKERECAEALVRASLGEKEVLLKEIHHRVKNNLQIISSLLSLQSAEIEDPRMLALFAESEHRVRSMALIHEKLYRSSDLARINLREYADDLANYLLRAHGDVSGRVQMRVHAEDVMLAIDSGVPCGLVLNELIINSFKHAFPDGREGSIDIDIRRNGDGRIHIIVEDDGVGLPEDFLLEETTSLGMQLFVSLGEQLDADIELTSDHGTRAYMAFEG